jgi:hypothetical protein
MHWGGYSGSTAIPDQRGYYLDVIRLAISNIEDQDPWDNRELFEALNYWKDLSPYGVKKFEKGLNACSLKDISEAVYAIERYI